MKTQKKFAVLVRDWSYINRLGETVTFKKGRRFQLTSTTYWTRQGSLALLNWYGYGFHELIDQDFFKK